MHGVLGTENWKWEMDKGSLVYPGYTHTFSRYEKRTGYQARTALTIKQNTISILKAASSRFLASNPLPWSLSP
jgi:hypothetical protein